MAAKKAHKADVEETAIVQDAPASLALPGLFENTGAQNYGDEHKAHTATVSAEERIVPTLRIVQDSSKIYKERREDDDIELGDIYSTSSGQIWKGTEGVLLVPLMLTSCVVKRTPSPEGKFLDKLDVDDPEVVKALERNEGVNGNKWARLENSKRETLNYTDEFACCLLDPADGVTPLGIVVVPFHGTNVYPRRHWSNKMAEVPHSPIYSFRVVLSTEIRHGKTKDSHKFKADAYGGNWGGRMHLGCRFPEGHPVLTEFRKLVDEYLSGKHGETSYAADDAGDSESEKEEAAF
jgi:hypothetical protein